MNKISAGMGVFVLSMGISVAGWAFGPCAPIAQACKSAGYYKGGQKEGKGLVKDCVMPVVANTKRLPNTNFSQDQLQQCSAFISKKMKSGL